MASISKKLFLPALGFIFLFTFISLTYFLPRFLVTTLGEHNPWISYLYTYIIGTVFYITSVFFIFTRKVHPRRRKQVNTFIIILTALLLWGICLHGSWIYLALAFPFKGVI